MNPEICEDFNIKTNSIQNISRRAFPSIDHEHLTLVPINHIPRHRNIS